MNNRINNLTKMGLLVGLTAIAALCMAPPVRAGTQQSSAARKPPHGGSGGGFPYATASTVSQLIADINYANSAGGAITINLAPGATFDPKSADVFYLDGTSTIGILSGNSAIPF